MFNVEEELLGVTCICGSLCTLVLYSPIVAAWKGASLMAARPEYHTWAVSKAEYEEDGALRCRQRCVVT